MQLDSELRNKEISDMSIHEYCQKLKSVADLLSNLDAPVPDKTLVMYMLNGLNEKFDYVLNVIKHQKPFPMFEDAKKMLEMEETRLKKSHKVAVTHTDNPSSSTALITTNTQNQQTNTSRNNNNRGNRRGNRNKGRYNNNNYHQRPFYNNWNTPPPWCGSYNNWLPQQQAPAVPWQTLPNDFYPPRQFTPPPQSQAPSEAHLAHVNLQLTKDFAEAFNTMTLADPSQTDGSWTAVLLLILLRRQVCSILFLIRTHENLPLLEMVQPFRFIPLDILQFLLNLACYILKMCCLL